MGSRRPGLDLDVRKPLGLERLLERLFFLGQILGLRVKHRQVVVRGHVVGSEAERLISRLSGRIGDTRRGAG